MAEGLARQRLIAHQEGAEEARRARRGSYWALACGSEASSWSRDMSVPAGVRCGRHCRTRTIMGCNSRQRGAKTAPSFKLADVQVAVVARLVLVVCFHGYPRLEQAFDAQGGQ